MKTYRNSSISDLFHQISKKVEGDQVLILSPIDLKNRNISTNFGEKKHISIDNDSLDSLNHYEDGYFDSVVLYKLSTIINKSEDAGKKLIEKVFYKTKYNGKIFFLDYIKSIENTECYIEFKEKQMASLFEKYSKETGVKIFPKDTFTWKTNENHVMAFYYNVIAGELNVPFSMNTEQYKDFLERTLGSKIHLIYDKLYIPKVVKKTNKIFALTDLNGLFRDMPDMCYIMEYKKANYLFLV